MLINHFLYIREDAFLVQGRSESWDCQELSGSYASFADCVGVLRPPHCVNGAPQVCSTRSEKADEWSCSNQATDYSRLVGAIATVMALGAKRIWCCDAVSSRIIVFFGFLRVGEVVAPSGSGFDPSWHLTVADVSIDDHACPTYVVVRINATKTNPFRRDITVYLGRMEGVVCPVTVAALLSYIVRRGALQGPLFVFEDGKSLTQDRFVGTIRSCGSRPLQVFWPQFQDWDGVLDSLIKTTGFERARPLHFTFGH